MAEHVNAITGNVPTGRLPDAGRNIAINANADQRKWLANELGVDSVDEFAAEVVVKPWRKNGVRVTGCVTGQVTQKCIVTLDLITEKISEAFDRSFIASDENQAIGTNEVVDILFDPIAPDEPDSFEGGFIDIAAVAIEQFALAIDLYPRKPDAVVPESTHYEDPNSELEKKTSPFAKLAELKNEIDSSS